MSLTKYSMSLKSIICGFVVYLPYVLLVWANINKSVYHQEYLTISRKSHLLYLELKAFIEQHLAIIFEFVLKPLFTCENLFL